MADRRKASDKEGFVQVFRKRVRESQGGDMTASPTHPGDEENLKESRAGTAPGSEPGIMEAMLQEVTQHGMATGSRPGGFF
eukprot:16055627-Heterocapsa_arctica.AAC.1